MSFRVILHIILPKKKHVLSETLLSLLLLLIRMYAVSHLKRMSPLIQRLCIRAGPVQLSFDKRKSINIPSNIEKDRRIVLALLAPLAFTAPTDRQTDILLSTSKKQDYYYVLTRILPLQVRRGEHWYFSFDKAPVLWIKWNTTETEKSEDIAYVSSTGS